MIFDRKATNAEVTELLLKHDKLLRDIKDDFNAIMDKGTKDTNTQKMVDSLSDLMDSTIKGFRTARRYCEQ